MTDVAAVLRHYPADFVSEQIEPLHSAGGMSGAEFWRIVAAGGVFVLRRWPPEHPTPEQLGFIHSVLAHVASRGVAFLPLPIKSREGQTFIQYGERLWQFEPWMPGTADYEQCPSDAKLRAAMEALARFHVAAATFPQKVAMGPASAVTQRLTRLRKLAGGETLELERAVGRGGWTDFNIVAREFLSALPRVINQAISALEPLAIVRLPLQPCIRDIWHDHVLFTGERVTGIVDFGAVDIDTPATDITRLIGSLAGDDAAAWRSGIAAYEEIRPLSPNERAAIPALDAAGTILAGCNWIRWVCVDGRTFDNADQILHRFQSIARRCSNPLR